MSLSRQLSRGILFFAGLVFAIPCLVNLFSYPSDKEKSERRRHTFHEAAGIVEHLLAKEGKLPREVGLEREPGRRISVSPWNFRESSLAGNRSEWPKIGDTKAYTLTYGMDNGNGVDTFESVTRKSSLDGNPSLFRRLMGSAFLFALSFFCFRTAASLYQGIVDESA